MRVTAALGTRGIAMQAWLSRRAAVCAAVLVSLVASSARAQPASEPVVAPPAVPPPPGLNFEFFDAQGGELSPARQAELERKVKRRRWMLATHQLLGLTTWAAMVATVTVGQLNYNQLYGGGGGSTKYWVWHRDLVIATSTLFVATATFSLLAPTPYRKPLHFDPGLVHRIAVIAASAGMVTQIVLGIWTNRQAQMGNPNGLRDMARAHQVVGYTTLGFLTIAGAAWLF